MRFFIGGDVGRQTEIKFWICDFGFWIAGAFGFEIFVCGADFGFSIVETLGFWRFGIRQFNFAQNDCGVFDCGVLLECDLDFFQLDAKAANVYPPVVAAGPFDVAVG